MNRKERTWVLVEDQTALAAELAAQARKLFNVEVREEPRLMLIMNKIRESAQNSLFYGGETLVTRARVVIQDKSGLGLICGEHYQKALNLAIIDAAYEQLPAAEKNAWDNQILEHRKQLLAELGYQQYLINQTKVSFEVMEVEEQS
ncbi:phosphonate C-P lyase system protein PhnG [Candidatus Enterococcus murrayae]|uniref:Phosphonate C-P lyase system protein PhnG n=1 Tax=Candidatus Enterococcus murrayae TaxID=2815321 RepID=A0ABS3HJ62_9ENTE|nr:phosphonate C-P lyase system protein PhnG [Enterococcus sp. MJM16]MBO0453501.1 phosphonate C-P lyase system protein PhnG [Enterococcus sp. MJM16]